MQDQLSNYFNKLFHDAMFKVTIFLVALIFILAVASAVYIWYEWKER